jgi:hypothetical protein
MKISETEKEMKALYHRSAREKEEEDKKDKDQN